MDKVGAGQLVEQRAHQVRLAAAAERPVAERLRTALRIGCEVLDAVHRQAGRYRHDQGHITNRRHRRKIARDVVGERWQHHRIEHEGGVVGQQEGVSVRLRLGDRVGADHGVGAALVLYHHRLAQLLGHALRQLPGDDVGGAAGSVRHDHPDRLRGIGLRLRGTCARQADHAKHRGTQCVRGVSFPVHSVSVYCLQGLPARVAGFPFS
ncbi:hypothetical protein D3C72_1493460 [compost metagenome]